MTEDKTATRRTAFVTGASHGIGAACAIALARDGFDVAVSALHPEGLGETVGKIEAAGARTLAVSLDLRSQTSIEAAMSAVLRAFGSLDLLVNNAGVLLRKAVVDVTRDEWDAVLDVNLAGTFFMCQQMGKYLIGAARKGSIINLGSTHGAVGAPIYSVYGISKAGIAHLTRMLAIEWAGHGIRVNAIAPGTTETRTRAEGLRADPARRQMLIERIPVRRFCTEEEVAGLAAYLASPQADYITGQTLLLDGGLTAY